MRSVANIPLWLHGMLRILLPLPCASILTALYTWICVNQLSDVRFRGWAWAVLGSVILGIGVFTTGWLSPRLFLRAFSVPCPSCKQAARLENRKNRTTAYRCSTCGTCFNSHWNSGQLIGGLSCAGTGLTLLTIGVTMPEASDVKAPILLSLISLFLIGLGTGLIGQKPLWDRLARRMPWMNRVPWETMIGGGIATGLGVIFICVGLLSEDESNMPAGRGPVVAAGAAFAFAGLCILLPSLGDYFQAIPRRIISRLATILASCLLLSFVAIPALIVWHDAGTSSAHPVPYISAGIMIALLGILTYVYFRDRNRKKGR